MASIDLGSIVCVDMRQLTHVPAVFTEEEAKLIAMVLAARSSDNPTVASALTALHVTTRLAEPALCAVYDKLVTEMVWQMAGVQEFSMKVHDGVDTLVTTGLRQNMPEFERIARDLCKFFQPLLARNRRVFWPMTERVKNYIFYD